LKARGELPEAVVAYRMAIELKPDFAAAYSNLGGALLAQGNLPDAVAAFRKAIDLKPDLAPAHRNLGSALARQEKFEEAEAALRKAIRFNPGLAEAHNDLGWVLRSLGKPEGAEGAYRKAIELKPTYAQAHCNLGQLLRRKGQFRQAAEHLRRGHELGSRNPTTWPYPSAEWLRRAEQMAQSEGRLPAVLQGKAQPRDAAECLAFAVICQERDQCYAAAARFYAEAFTRQPALAADLRFGDRYEAACAAALAGCGQGKDADHLDAKERARLRRQARDWLRDQLAAWDEVLTRNHPEAAAVVRQKMRHWLRDADFTGVRDPKALAKLPEAERADWRRLWAQVQQLAIRAEGKVAALSGTPVPEK
jgi:Tfp pilus assembly protein PilF